MSPGIAQVSAWVLMFLLAGPRISAQNLRGFGNVRESSLPAGQGMQFACDSPEHATLLIHKLAHDMAPAPPSRPNG